MRPARPDDRELFFTTRRDGFRSYVEVNKPWVDDDQRASAYADFAALPSRSVATERNRGIGTDLVRAIMAAARRANPARHLYDRLGFRVIADEDIRVRMEWP